MMQALIVEPDLSMREWLYDTLSRKDFEVASAGTREQGFEILKNHQPALIMLDADLPDGTGWEMAAKIRGFDTQVSLVVLCDKAGEAVSLPTESGGIEVIKKSSDLMALLRSIEDVLSKIGPGQGIEEKKPSESTQGKLLIVDDDAQLQKLLRGFFSGQGLEVLVAGCGEEAVQAIDAKPDVVLLDINMPGMDGVMTLKKLKAKEPSIPVVMMSGAGEQGMARDALAIGAYDYISKPFDLKYLEEVVLTKVRLGFNS